MKIRYEPLWEFESITREDTPDGRFYNAPSGRYPSMTTVLSADKEKQKKLEEWRNRVGHNVANDITRRAGRRGTFIHTRLEHYLQTGTTARPQAEQDNKRVGEFEKQMHDDIFRRFVNEMERHMDRYHANEVSLYSNLMRIAGSVDLVAPWDGKLSIIDFKTSLKPKKKEWITDYFLQTTGYAMMLDEMKGTNVEQIVILVTPNNEDICQVFVESPKNYRKQLAQRILTWKMENRK